MDVYTTSSAKANVYCRYLLADGNGRLYADPMPGATQSNPALLRCLSLVSTQRLSAKTAALVTSMRRLSGSQAPMARLMRRVYGDNERFKRTYFERFPGVYTTGDGARKDADGYYWLMGRIDESSKSPATVSAR